MCGTHKKEGMINVTNKSMYRNYDEETLDEYDEYQLDTLRTGSIYDDQLDPLRTGSIFRADLKYLRNLTPEVAKKFNLLVSISPVPEVLRTSKSISTPIKSLASRRQNLDDLDLRKPFPARQ